MLQQTLGLMELFITDIAYSRQIVNAIVSMRSLPGRLQSQRLAPYMVDAISPPATPAAVPSVWYKIMGSHKMLV